MKILANKDIRNLFLAVSVIWAASLLLAQGFLWLRYQRLSLCLLFIFLLAAAAINYYSVSIEAEDSIEVHSPDLPFRKYSHFLSHHKPRNPQPRIYQS